MPPANLRSRETFQRNRKTKNRVPSAPNASSSTASEQQPSASAAMVHHFVAQRDAQLQGSPIMGNVEASPSVQMQHQLQHAQAKHAQPSAQHFIHQKPLSWAQKYETQLHQQQQQPMLTQRLASKSSPEQSTQKAPSHAQPQEQLTAFSHDQPSVHRSQGSSSRQLLQRAVHEVQVEDSSAFNPSRAIRSTASGAQQLHVLTMTMNPCAGAATVPYHFATSCAISESEQIESGNESKSQIEPERKAEHAPVPENLTSAISVGRTEHGGDSFSKAGRGAAKQDEGTEEDRIAEYVAQTKAWAEGPCTRPRILQAITGSNADTLRISRLPRGVTYDKLYRMVDLFGDVEELSWCPSEPYVCEVTYRDPAAAHEAKQFLGDALFPSDFEPPLKAELHSRDTEVQLFVGDLTPDVTEEMLEQSFSKLVGEPVKALLKRNTKTSSPIGYGFLSFRSESSANFVLHTGRRVKIGNACVRIERAEQNTYLYVSDLSPSVTMSELTNLFGRFGALDDEDTVIVRRSYAFVKYKNRNAAEKAKQALDNTDLKGRVSVRYAEPEPLKECIAVQFHSSVPQPPKSLRDIVLMTFAKHGKCSVEIPLLSNGMWRNIAFVTFHGDPVTARLAALDAVQTVRFISSFPVCCQFVGELIPKLPVRGF